MKYRTIIITILSLLMSNVLPQEFIPARPYGGNQQLDEFICNEMVYPEHELKNGIEGTVKLSFTVDKDGSIKDIQVYETVSEGIDNEAISILKKIIWIPACKMGKIVSIQVKLPIKFNIKKYNKYCRKRGYKTIEYLYQPIDTSNIVYTNNTVDKIPKPVFNDTKQTLHSFINNNLKYPESAFRQNISGKVEISFVVETHDIISHIVIDKPLGGGCSQEAIRIIKLIKWKPGIKNNKAVRTRISFHITFRLPNNQKLQYIPNTHNTIM